MISTGHLIPPLFVFPRKNMKQELLTDTQLDQSTLAIPRDGYRAGFSPCGFYVFFKRKKPTTKNSVSLVLNGYYSHTHARTHAHTSNLEVFTWTRVSRVDIICLPPCSSRKIQNFGWNCHGDPENLLLSNWRMVLRKPRTISHRLSNWWTIRRCTQ